MQADLIGEMLKLSFMQIDEALRQLPEVVRGDDHSGCTAIAAVITSTHIVVANAGTRHFCSSHLRISIDDRRLRGLTECLG